MFCSVVLNIFCKKNHTRTCCKDRKSAFNLFFYIVKHIKFS